MLPGRDFTLLLVGTTLSAVGTAMIPVGLSFALLGAGHSAGALGIVLAAQAVPAVGLLLLGGVLGDRWPRRRLMIAADMLCFAAQSVLALLLLRGAAPLPTIGALAALIGAGTAFFQPAKGGLVAEIVANEELARANSALGAAAAIAAIAGPALAGLVVGIAGPAWAVGIDALSYASSAVCLLLVRETAGVRGNALPAASLLQDLRIGLHTVARRRWLCLIVIQFGLLNLVAFAPLLVLAPVLLARVPHGAQHWGWLLSVAGVGGLLGAVALIGREPGRAGMAIEAAALLLVVPLVLFALDAPLPILFPGAFSFGAGEAMINVMILTLVQRAIPQELLSRVVSIVQIAAGVMAPAGYALAGPAAGWLGTRAVLLAGAGVSVISVILLSLSRELRRSSVRGTGEYPDTMGTA